MAESPTRWGTIERLYHSALARSVNERAAFLAEACAGNEQLRREVESLLAQDASADAVLTRGAVVAAAGLVSDVGGSVLIGRRLGAYQILAPSAPAAWARSTAPAIRASAARSPSRSLANP